MPYTIIDFDGVNLPTAMPTDDLGTGEVESTLRDSIGGVFDYYESRQRTVRRHRFSHMGKYVGSVDTRITDGGDTRVTDGGDTRVTAGSVLEDLSAKTAALKSREGVRGKLWRKSLQTGDLTWKRCRLLEVMHEETVENAQVVSEVESIYETDQAGWRSEDAVTTSNSLSDGTQTAFSVTNSGALIVHDAVLTVTQTSGTITQVDVEWLGQGIDFTWSGSLGSGDELEIDCGRNLVRKNGSDAFSGFTLNSNHSARGWMPLPVGESSILITVTGGGADVTIEHYDQEP